jgi:hypothetical protein
MGGLVRLNGGWASLCVDQENQLIWQQSLNDVEGIRIIGCFFLKVMKLG